MLLQRARRMFGGGSRAHEHGPVLDILVLGFYDRGNAGDEMYKVAFREIFSAAGVRRLDFRCIDDVGIELPEGYDIVVCGGGDLINDYFMPKVRALLSGFGGRVYAVSVGIPYASCAHHLDMFDHVFVRSSEDYDIARARVGSLNVTRMPDAFFALPATISRHGDRGRARGRHLRLAVCLARPVLVTDPGLAVRISGAIRTLLRADADVEVRLVPFNTFGRNSTECDIVANDEIVRLVCDGDGDRDRDRRRRCVSEAIHGGNSSAASAAVTAVYSADVVLCLRYHSAVFSRRFNKTAVVLACTPKLERFAADNGNELHAVLEASATEGEIASALLTACSAARGVAVAASASTPSPFYDSAAVRRAIVADRVTSRILVRPPASPAFGTVRSAKAAVRTALFRAARSADVQQAKGQRQGQASASKDPDAIAQIVSLVLTGSASSRYCYGLSQNCRAPGFDVDEAVGHIWEDQVLRRSAGAADEPEVYCPPCPLAPQARRYLVDFDEYAHSDADCYHRSGWPFVMRGLMCLHAGRSGRAGHEGQPRRPLFLDTMVDRTFHWERAAKLATGAVPYRRPWIGIVHHTFDERFPNNCAALFRDAAFVASLATCRCLIALSVYLAKRLRAALDEIGFSSVEVSSLMHPTETPEDGGFARWTREAFEANRERRLVQVGTWMREDWALRDLDLGRDALCLRKTALRVHANKGKGKDHALGHAPMPAEDEDEEEDEQDRDAEDDVDELFLLSASAYDDLLSENVVFLKLADCSAVNTVLECVVRATPLIVDRHPALEEVLGATYPGFYDDLPGASSLANDFESVLAMHAHLAALPPDRLHVSTFVQDVHGLIARFSPA